MVSETGFNRLITGKLVVRCFGSITRGCRDSVHDFGHLVNASCGLAQSTSGLWACSQSVPKITSWSPKAVTYSSARSS